MDFVDHSTALSALQQIWATGKVRAHMVSGPAMEPTLYDGEFAGIVPGDRFEFDGIYLLDESGRMPGIWRCCWRGSLGGKILCWQDNPVFSQQLVLTRAEFQDICLGRVISVVGYVDRPRGHQDRRAA